jgi:hypothetical protein
LSTTTSDPVAGDRILDPSGPMPSPGPRTVDAFLLSREWHEEPSGLEIVVWGRAPEVPVRARFTGREAVMFVPRGAGARADRRAPVPLATLHGVPVDALYFRSQRGLLAERDRIRREHGVESHLELRFESHYARFLMPTTRGAARGSKKRYAGLVRKGDAEPRLVVRGLEAVRTDWTPLARRVQRELLRRVFTDEPFASWLEGIARDLAAGRLDDELVYTKALRRDLDAYASEGVPPHVRAARIRQGDAHGKGEGERQDDAQVDGFASRMRTSPPP